MRLYTTPSGAWFGTQSEARRIAKEFNTSWTEANVPTDKEGLISFLNTHNVGAEIEKTERLPAPPIQSAVDISDLVDLTPGPIVRHVPETSTSFTANQIADFILDHATVAQVENIFACLGTRFAENRS